MTTTTTSTLGMHVESVSTLSVTVEWADHAFPHDPFISEVLRGVEQINRGEYVTLDVSTLELDNEE